MMQYRSHTSSEAKKEITFLLLKFLKNYKANNLKLCLKSNGTVYAARKTFIAEKKVLFSMMSQCLMVSKTKFQHSVTTAFFIARFSFKALSL